MRNPKARTLCNSSVRAQGGGELRSQTRSQGAQERRAGSLGQLRKKWIEVLLQSIRRRKLAKRLRRRLRRANVRHRSRRCWNRTTVASPCVCNTENRTRERTVEGVERTEANRRNLLHRAAPS